MNGTTDAPRVSTPAPPAPVRLPVRPAWLALRREDIIAPALPIVDAHHHLWDLPGNRYLFGDLLDDAASGHNVIATVFMQSHAHFRETGDIDLRPVGETAFANAVAEESAGGAHGRFRACAGIVGEANLLLGDRVARVLEAHVEAGGGRFRGVRHLSNWHADPAARGTGNAPPGLLLDPVFRAGFARLAPLGLSFDAWMYHTQLDDAGALAAAFPQTTIVLDHAGGPIGVGPYAGRRDEVFAAWRASIRKLARHPNVCVKLGGLGMRLFGAAFHEQPAPPPSQELAAAWRPWLETAIEAFGPGRAMFESNAPVDKGTCSYHVLWNAFKRVTAGASAEDQAALFAGTATRVYRLERPAA